MINRRKRRDGNHAEVLAAFERMGWRTLDCSQLGGGAPDAIVSRHGRTVAVEIKVAKGKVKPHQAAWLAAWGGEVAIVRGLEDVAALSGAR